MQPCSWKNCITLCFGSLENVVLLAYHIKVKERGRIQMLCCFRIFIFLLYITEFVDLFALDCMSACCVRACTENYIGCLLGGFWVYAWLRGTPILTWLVLLGIAQMSIVLSLCHDSCQKKKVFFSLNIKKLF